MVFSHGASLSPTCALKKKAAAAKSWVEWGGSYEAAIAMTDCLGNIPELNLCFSQGSDQEVVLDFTPQSETDPPVDFTDARAAAYFRTSTSASTFNEFTVRIDDGILGSNQIALGLESSVMELLEPRAYEYDLKVVFDSGRTWTPFRGTLTLIANNTRGTDFL